MVLKDLRERRRRAIPFLFAASISLTVTGCGEKFGSGPSSPVQNAQKETARPEVRVTEAEMRNWPETVRVQGTLLPHERSVIGTRIAGIVARIEVDLGTTVRKGSLLVALDEKELALSVLQAEAQLTQACAVIGLKPDDAEDNLNRDQAPPVLIERAALDEAISSAVRGKQLLERRAITNEEFQRLEAIQKAADARYKSALNNVGSLIALVHVRRAELAQAKQQLVETQIVAPYDGVVEERHVSPGEHVSPGDSIVTLVRADTLRYRAGVPERDALQIRPGQAVQIFLEETPKPIEAKVSRVSPALTMSSRSLWIEADVPNPELARRTGLFAEAEIVVNPQTKALTVPESAIAEFAGIEKVWTVRAGQASEIAVKTGRRREHRIEILEGLAAGDLIVVNSREGQAGAVTVVKEKSELRQTEDERRTAASQNSHGQNGSD